MKSLISAAALAVFFVLGDGVGLGAQAQTKQSFAAPEKKVCKGIEHDLSLYLGGRWGEFQEEIIEGNHDGQNVIWVLWRNQFSQTWTLSTNDGTDECIIAWGVGYADEGIEYFIDRALTLTMGTAL